MNPTFLWLWWRTISTLNIIALNCKWCVLFCFLHWCTINVPEMFWKSLENRYCLMEKSQLSAKCWSVGVANFNVLISSDSNCCPKHTLFKSRSSLPLFNLLFIRKAVVQHLIHAFQRSSGSALVKTFRVNYKRHVLTMDDLGTLYGQNWLNDQVQKWTFKYLIQCFKYWLNVHICFVSSFEILFLFTPFSYVSFQ